MIHYQSDKIDKPEQCGDGKNFPTPFLHALGSSMIFTWRQNSTGFNQPRKNHAVKHRGNFVLALYLLVLHRKFRWR